jgi:hypothetical protein
MKWTDIPDKIPQWGLFIIALVTVIYGLAQYKRFKSEKRPYVSLIKVNVESNLTKSFPIFHPVLKKDVQPIEIIQSDQKAQVLVEEIVVDLVYKNTGPLAAKDIDIRSIILTGDRYDLDGKENPKSIINDETDFRRLNVPMLQERQTNLVSLLPEQEKADHFLLHKNEIAQKFNIMRNDSTTTNYLYLVNTISYTSSGGEKYSYFSVYKIWHPAAYTRIYYALLIKSESI